MPNSKRGEIVDKSSFPVVAILIMVGVAQLEGLRVSPAQENNLVIVIKLHPHFSAYTSALEPQGF
jgi:hypothetical protein